MRVTSRASLAPMRIATCATLVFWLLAGVACGGPELQFADWIEPLPREGVPIHEYAAVSYEDRAGNVIDVVDDLVLGDDLNPEEAFFQPSYVNTDADGNIFVLDRGDPRIQVFDPEGNYLRTIGHEGQGPGEFARPSYLVVTDDYVVMRADTRRISIWTQDGEHVRDTQLTDSLLGWMGFDQGFVARRVIREEAASPEQMPPAVDSYSVYDAFGEPVAALLDIQEPEATVLTLPGGGWLANNGFIPEWGVLTATARDGSFYVTTSAEYQLHAYGPRPWSLRVAWPREPVTEEHVNTVKERLAASEGMLAQLDLSGVEWPEHHPSIRGLEVDGHGHIYVYPFLLERHRPFARDEEPPDVPRMVDVYSPDGEMLFSGLLDLGGWTSARGDFVYTTRTNDITEETEVVRLRLVEPF